MKKEEFQWLDDRIMELIEGCISPKEEIEYLSWIQEVASNQIEKIALRNIPDFNWMSHKVLNISCDSRKNPLELCVFDRDWVNSLDGTPTNCIFCGEPVERK